MRAIPSVDTLRKVTQMPKEVHYFLFFREEVQQALLDHHALLNADVRAAHADSLALSEKGGSGVSARLTVRESTGGAARELLFAPPDVLAATIQYCRSRRIPLARRSEKIVKAVGDQLVLASVINLRMTRPKSETRKRAFQSGRHAQPLQTARTFGRQKSQIAGDDRAGE
jgi:hypothetical protein